MRLHIVIVALGGLFLWGAFASAWTSYCVPRTYSMYDWQALAPTLTGPLGPNAAIRAGINASCKFDWDRDADLDLRDVAAFQNGVLK